MNSPNEQAGLSFWNCKTPFLDAVKLQNLFSCTGALHIYMILEYCEEYFCNYNV